MGGWGRVGKRPNGAQLMLKAAMSHVDDNCVK